LGRRADGHDGQCASPVSPVSPASWRVSRRRLNHRRGQDSTGKTRCDSATQAARRVVCSPPRPETRRQTTALDAACARHDDDTSLLQAPKPLPVVPCSGGLLPSSARVPRPLTSPYNVPHLTSPLPSPTSCDAAAARDRWPPLAALETRPHHSTRRRRHSSPCQAMSFHPPPLPASASRLPILS
jgi:hypothetical protein